MIRLVAGLVISAFFLSAAELGAEVYNCSGTWQSQPCNGPPQAVLRAQPRRELSQAEKDMESKKTWLHDLEMRVLKVKRATGHEARAALARELCTRAETSLADCSRAIGDVEGLLIDLMLEDKAAADGGGRRSKAAEKIVQQVEQNSTVVVVDNSRDLPHCDPLRHPGCSGRRVPAAGQPHRPAKPAQDKPPQAPPDRGQKKAPQPRGAVSTIGR